jgi:hypothetical protein
MSERMSMEQERDSLAECAHALAYQAEMEAEYGGGSVAVDPLVAALNYLVTAYGRLTTADDAAELYAAAGRAAGRAVQGD